MTDHTTLRQSLLLLAGPLLVWFGHFSAIYATATLACNHQFDPGPVLLSVTVIALCALALLSVWSRAHEATASISTWSRALSAFAALAIAWSVLAAALSPSGCG